MSSPGKREALNSDQDRGLEKRAEKPEVTVLEVGQLCNSLIGGV